jgi:hypothetical protein
MSDPYPPEAPQLVHVFNVREIMTQLEEARARNTQLEEFIEEFTRHESWRCRFHQACHCGLDQALINLGLPGIPIE